MKRFSIFALAAIFFAACATDQTADMQPIDASETLTVSFEEETRIQLNEAQKTVWTEGDLVSVFYKSDANQKWQFQGKTGDRTGTIKRVNAGSATRTMDKVVVVYPYSENYLLNLTTGDIEAMLPATQHYLEGSYGLDGNIMVSSSYFTQVSLKNVCGWLKLQLMGNGEKVKSITLKGNNGEQVAGLIYVNTENATSILASEMGVADDNENGVGGNLVFEDTIIKEVTLDCGEGVTLGEEATAFYIALPPQTFEKGLTVEIKIADGGIMTKSTENSISIERNTIQPMTALAIIPKKHRTIYYESISPNEKLIPYNPTAFGTTIISNICGEDRMGEIIFKDAVTKIGNKAFYYEPRIEGNTTYIECILYGNIIPESVTTIGNQAFYGQSSLRNVVIPESVTTIGDEAFGQCWNLDKLIIPSSVTYVGNNVSDNLDIYFAGSIPPTLAINALQDVERFIYVPYEHIESYRSTWSNYADKILGYDFVNNHPAPANNQIYYKTTDKEVIDSQSLYGNLGDIVLSNTYSESGVIDTYDNGDLGVITFKNNITELGEGEFQYCKTLKAVYIPTSVESIAGSYSELNSDNSSIGAFRGLNNLELVAIYGTPQIIGNPFVNYYETSKISTFIGPLASSDGRCLVTGTTIHCFAPAGIDEYTIPSGITTIDAYAFINCQNLRKITIPASVNKFGYDAFNNCYNLSVNITNLTNWCKMEINNKYANPIYVGGEPLYINGVQISTLIIPSSITTINKYVFEGVSVSEIVIGDNVTTIEDFAFEWNRATKITIGKNVKTIGAYAFNDTDSYPENADVYIKATTPPTARYNQYGYWSAFDCHYSDRKIYVPRASVSQYKSAAGWSSYASYIEEYDFSVEQ